MNPTEMPKRKPSAHAKRQHEDHKISTGSVTFLDFLIFGLANVVVGGSEPGNVGPIPSKKRQRSTTWKTDLSRLDGTHTPCFVEGKREDACVVMILTKFN